ncbi:MAG: hypothetical protein RJB39_148 [Candidatus Parcubacteria bacterium]|jgi:hypothetical protein
MQIAKLHVTKTFPNTVRSLPNRIVGPDFHQIQLFGQQTFDEADWATALNIFASATERKESGAMQRPYLFLEDVTLRYDEKDDSYYVYGAVPHQPEEVQHPAIQAAMGRIAEADLRDGPKVRHAIMTFLGDERYAILGLYQGRATEGGSPMFMIKRTEDPDIFILRVENLPPTNDEALEHMLMRGAK